jgi:hypothetical protein
MAERSSDLTLAFTVDALAGLEQPAAAVEDARAWTEYVGIVSPEPNRGIQYTRERRIRMDFFSGTRTVEETLCTVGQTYGTERHLLIGTDPREQELADRVGWEYHEFEEAAERAGWNRGTSEESGHRWVDRLWPF